MDVVDNSVSGVNASAADLSPRSEWLLIAAFFSIGAGAVHAAAVGAHSELPQVATVFLVLSLAQIGWGAAVLAAGSTPLLRAGAILNAVAVIGWIAAKTTGVGFIDGLETAEGVGTPDGIAAFAAAVSVVAVLLGSVRVPQAPHGGFRPLPALAALIVAAVAVPAMAASADHAATGHGHLDVTSGSADTAAVDEHGENGHVDVGHDAAPAGHVASEVATAPYDPLLPIDLGGVEGVTPEQQARAENLVAITLARLPHFADTATAEAEGYRSIGDEFTGHEHFINWDYLQDGQTLNPDRPESLVYEQRNGRKTLVSAMFMLERGQGWESVPDIGGALTQWHIHDDLCFTDDPVAPRVASVTSVGGSCSPPLKKLTPVPMIHVWIVSHACGPFAALSGVGAGQIPDGETRLCDTAHGTG